MKPIPAEFDAAYYSAGNTRPKIKPRKRFGAFLKSQSLRGSPDRLERHFRDEGMDAGLPGSAVAFRENFIGLIEAGDSALEIGPFTRPVLRGPAVRYFDVLDTEALVARAESIGYPVDDPPHIDFVSPVGDLSVVPGGDFDAVFSSHCIEHQPDLVAHLSEVERILRPGGRYFLIVPDKRFMFDHFLPESTLAGVTAAHAEGRRVHALASVIETRALGTHNDPARHWRGDHGRMAVAVNPGAVASAMDEFHAANGAYIDVHAWQFTPEGFRAMIGHLGAMGLTGLQAIRVYNTPRDRFEFCAVLEKPAAD